MTGVGRDLKRRVLSWYEQNEGPQFPSDCAAALKEDAAMVRDAVYELMNHGKLEMPEKTSAC